MSKLWNTLPPCRRVRNTACRVSGAAAERGAAYKWPGIEPAPPAAAAHTRDGDQRGHPDRAAAAVRLRLQVTCV